MLDDEAIDHDQLRLIFTCCHPALRARPIGPYCLQAAIAAVHAAAATAQQTDWRR